MATTPSNEAAALPPPNGIDTDIEVATGAVAGAVAGAMAGPVGAIVGAGVGTAVALLADEALHRDDREKRERDRVLDDTIGVTQGSLGAEVAPGFVRPVEIAATLRAEHDDLELLAGKLLSIVEEGDREDVRTAFTILEERLLAHLDAEETALFPRYAEVAPEDEALLREDHGAFRRMLDELDVTIDLHLVRLETVRELVMKLAAHAHRENVTLYRWAANEAATSF
jgi:hypothetical protein